MILECGSRSGLRLSVRMSGHGNKGKGKAPARKSSQSVPLNNAPGPPLPPSPRLRDNLELDDEDDDTPNYFGHLGRPGEARPGTLQPRSSRPPLPTVGELPLRFPPTPRPRPHRDQTRDSASYVSTLRYSSHRDALLAAATGTTAAEDEYDDEEDEDDGQATPRAGSPQRRREGGHWSSETATFMGSGDWINVPPEDEGYLSQQIAQAERRGFGGDDPDSRAAIDLDSFMQDVEDAVDSEGVFPLEDITEAVRRSLKLPSTAFDGGGEFSGLQ